MKMETMKRKDTTMKMQTITTNWKSSLAGLLILAGVGFQLYKDPSIIVKDPKAVMSVLAGAGLLAAADAKDSKKEEDSK